tara:strand:+ start:101 stop:208 length:108 start_codon:yes stop_codon:yes gene_type:complete
MTKEEIKKRTKQVGGAVAILVAAIVAMIELLEKGV